MTQPPRARICARRLRLGDIDLRCLRLCRCRFGFQPLATAQTSRLPALRPQALTTSVLMLQVWGLQLSAFPAGQLRARRASDLALSDLAITDLPVGGIFVEGAMAAGSVEATTTVFVASLVRCRRGARNGVIAGACTGCRCRRARGPVPDAICAGACAFAGAVPAARLAASEAASTAIAATERPAPVAASAQAVRPEPARSGR